MVSHASDSTSLDDLIRRFGRRFAFGTMRMCDHLAHTAFRRSGAAEPGLYFAATPDLGELADTLQADQDSRPAALPPGGGPGPAGAPPG